MVRLFSTLLAAAAVAAFPATAIATDKRDTGAKPERPAKEAQPDERAAARAFADAALAAAPAIEEAGAQLAAIGDPVRCDLQVPDSRRGEIDRLAGKLATAKLIAGFTRTVAPAMRRATRALDAIQTSDSALRRGRATWQRRPL